MRLQAAEEARDTDISARRAEGQAQLAAARELVAAERERVGTKVKSTRCVIHLTF